MANLLFRWSASICLLAMVACAPKPSSQGTTHQSASEHNTPNQEELDSVKAEGWRRKQEYQRDSL